MNLEKLSYGDQVLVKGQKVKVIHVERHWIKDKYGKIAWYDVVFPDGHKEMVIVK
jgi:hypothetical protein